MKKPVEGITFIQSGITVQYLDGEGFLREGTVTRTTTLGYSVLPTMGRRTIVPEHRLVRQ